MINVEINGVIQEAQPGELLIDLIERSGQTIPHVCYQPSTRPRCRHVGTCMVEENGRLIRCQFDQNRRWNNDLYKIGKDFWRPGRSI